MTVSVLKIVSTVNLTTSSVGYGSAVGTAVKQVIKRAIFSNFSGSSVTITVNIVPSTSPSTANQVINAHAIQAGETYVAPELSGMVLQPADQIYASCSAASAVNMTVSGIQVS